MQRNRIRIKVEKGPEASFVARLVQAANEYESKIYFDLDEKNINAKSIMGMMNLHLYSGEEIEITADGSDEVEALAHMVSLLAGESDE